MNNNRFFKGLIWGASCCAAMIWSLPLTAQPFGLSNRLANTTLTFPQQPQTNTYALVEAFPSVAVTNPICFASPPGETNRLFILERQGRVIAITNLAAPDRTVVLDLNVGTNNVATDSECGLLGLAFHPNFAVNRYFFLFYSKTNWTSADGSGRHQRVARFQMTATNNNAALLASELPLITQFDQAGNHNGGDLHFGPDGYLYVSVGDEGNPQGDGRNNSQTIRKDFFSGILRLDVDMNPTNLPPNPHNALLGVTNYFVPADNPWVSAPLPFETNTTGVARTEFFAVGLRNPWRFSIDTNGAVWVGDVGGINDGAAREEVNLIVKGGNYGWAFREGFEIGPVVATNNKAAQAPPGYTYVPPITYYRHTAPPAPSAGDPANITGLSITGGRVYRGSNIPHLVGKYVFCDFSSGYVWALTPNGTNYVPMPAVEQLINAGGNSIAAFGADPRNGDLLTANVATGGTNVVRRLVAVAPAGTPLPATLVDTGAFADFTLLTPTAGVVPFDVNVPHWTDGAVKSRWFAVPNTNLTLGWSTTNNWTFPTGTVWIQHFDLVTNHVTAQSTRLETRFLVRNAGGVYGATYRWGGATNAALVAEGGLDEAFVITDPGGVLRTQVWHYPSRQECIACHTAVGGFALGFNTAQLNRNLTYTNFVNATGVADNQLRALDRAGYLAPALSNRYTLPALANGDAAGSSLEWRARSYFAANCAQCHQPNGHASGKWDARYHVPTALDNLVGGVLASLAANTNARVIVPGSLTDSMIYQRLGTNTGTPSTHMPPLATSVTDTNALNLIAAWIGSASLASYQTFAQWQLVNFGSTNAANALAGADPDGDGVFNQTEFLLGTNPNSATNDWKVDVKMSGTNAQIVFPQIANRAFEVQLRTNLDGVTTPWLPLDVPGNTPFYSLIDFTNTVTDITGSGTNKFYRVRVSAP